ncbi:hypothetical protein KKB06_06025 [Patescibacteria group bacterium]|nr:hypothetical protein [Patescibacteria group bacterium]
MTIHEGFRNLGSPEISEGVRNILGVKFRFDGFEAGMVDIDLSTGEFDGLKSFLTIDKQHKPQDVSVVFDNETPKLAIVSGLRERWSKKGPLGLGVKDKYLGDTPYLYVIKADLEDNQLFVQGLTDLHPLEDRGGKGMVIDYYFPETYREGGVVTIKKDQNSLVIEAIQGKPTHLGRKN